MKHRPHPPMVMVEAGAEPWSRVEPLLDRRVNEIAGSGEIEIISADPDVLRALPDWCASRQIRIESMPEQNGARGFRLHCTRTSSEEL
ncbi:hypothetical protein [Kribbella catacumbae]|uniref:hypothetical protein n=1 Tax=Kribbella catacumbae TaxID=460086 RepID=UPI0003A37C54|nr:hypothetical protein [Kribbella catacumbae]